MGHRAGLAQAISLVDFKLDGFVYRVDQFTGQRGRSRGDHAQRTKIVFLHCGLPRKMNQDWRRDVDEGNPVSLHRLQEHVKAESLHDYCLNTSVQWLVDETGETWRGIRHRGYR